MLIDEVISIAREAGRMMIESKDIHVQDKDSKDNHVTNIDVAVQEFLRRGYWHFFRDPHSSERRAITTTQIRSIAGSWIP